MPRLLVIDDQADVRAMICVVLRVNHFEVVEAASATTGLKAFEACEFDLAIVDIFLEEANGFDVIRMMRDRVPNLPVVAISGMTAPEFFNASPDAGSVICLRKPFRPSELLRAIEAAQGTAAAEAG